MASMAVGPPLTAAGSMGSSAFKAGSSAFKQHSLCCSAGKGSAGTEMPILVVLHRLSSACLKASPESSCCSKNLLAARPLHAI